MYYRLKVINVDNAVMVHAGYIQIKNNTKVYKIKVMIFSALNWKKQIAIGIVLATGLH